MVYTLRELQKAGFDRKPHYLVVGNPIGHSLSPAMHQLALDYHQIGAEYVSLQLESHEIAQFAAWCNREAFLGCNVTIPYKETLKELVDQLDSSAMEAGVINTIARQPQHRLAGYNTDIAGFISPLLEFSDMLESGRAIVFGTGGASRAVVAGLKRLGIREVILVSRNPAGKQINDPEIFSEVVNYQQWTAYADEASLLVNTTPVGMSPKSEDRFFEPSDAEFFEGKICYDLIYNPIETTFLKTAEKAGGIPVGGLEMFIGQGNEAFRIWTGKEFPREAVRKLLISRLTLSDSQA
jgi:shikimate dehydrogenase